VLFVFESAKLLIITKKTFEMYVFFGVAVFVSETETSGNEVYEKEKVIYK